jgi:hypothetical protein
MAMSQDHKDALAEGRKQSRAIKAYLGAIQARKPGRPVTKDSIATRLRKVNAQLETSSDPLKSVQLVQTKLELEGQLAQVGSAVDLPALEKEFVTHARAYSDRKGISYTAWRQVGVPAATLKAAGIKETRVRR